MNHNITFEEVKRVMTMANDDCLQMGKGYIPFTEENLEFYETQVVVLFPELSNAECLAFARQLCVPYVPRDQMIINHKIASPKGKLIKDQNVTKLFSRIMG